MKLKYERIEYYILGCILLFSPFLFIDRGLDFTDVGYSISNFYNYEANYSYWMLSTLLSNVVGSILLKMPFADTYLGINVYCTLITCVVVWLIYNCLSKIFSHRLVFLGVLWAVCLQWCPRVVLYNYLTYFFLYLAIAFLIYGLKENKNWCLFLSGMMLGFNIFVRLPNIVQCCLLVGIFIYRCKEQGWVKKGFLEFIWSCSGVVVSVVVMFGYIALKHDLSDYYQMIVGLFGMSESNQSYSLASMLSQTILFIWKYKKELFCLGVIIAFAVVISKFMHNKILSALSSILAAGCIALLLRYWHYYAVFTMKDYNSYNSVDFFTAILIAACMISSGMMLFRKRSSNVERILAFVALFLSLFGNIGSNTGNLAIMNNLLLIAPCTLFFINRLIFVTDTKTEGISKYLSPKYCVATILILVISVQSLLFSVIYTYGDLGINNGLDKKITANRYLKNMYVLEGMNTIIEGVSEYVEANREEGRTCITYGNIPIMPMVLDLDSALSTAWPDLASYHYDDFASELVSLDENPLIIQNRWFTGGDIRLEEIREISPKAELLWSYICDNNYEVVYENDKFIIYDIKGN